MRGGKDGVRHGWSKKRTACETPSRKNTKDEQTRKHEDSDVLQFSTAFWLSKWSGSKTKMQNDKGWRMKRKIVKE